MTTDRRRFLREVHYLRAVAIVSIVANHIWHLPPSDGPVDWRLLWPMDLVNQTLFHGGSIYFVFISGLLFHHLQAGRFEARAYYRAKLLNVILPYLVFTAIAMLVGQAPPVDLAGTGSAAEVAQRYLGSYAQHVLYGSAQEQFWYLPFIAVVFLVSPLLLRLPHRWFGRIAAVALLLPLLGTRTGSELTAGQFLYFLPIYIAGMFFSLNYAAAMAAIERRIGWLSGIAGASTAALLGLYVANVVPPGHWVSERSIEAMQYLQKAAVGAVLLHYFRHASGWHMQLADALSRHSFPIFFAHLLVYEIIVHRHFWVHTDWHPLLFVSSLNYLASTLAICVLVSLAAHWLVGPRSRYLVGA